MGISNGVVVLLCILGAAAVTMIGFAFFRFYANRQPEDEESFNQRNDHQDAYMKEVRQRNQMLNWSESRQPRYPPAVGHSQPPSQIMT